jgi:hypothetical protein
MLEPNQHNRIWYKYVTRNPLDAIISDRIRVRVRVRVKLRLRLRVNHLSGHHHI